VKIHSCIVVLGAVVLLKAIVFAAYGEGGGSLVSLKPVHEEFVQGEPLECSTGLDAYNQSNTIPEVSDGAKHDRRWPPWFDTLPLSRIPIRAACPQILSLSSELRMPPISCSHAPPPSSG
jgi:hypothetical protein